MKEEWMSRFTILGSANAVPKPGQDNTHLLIESTQKSVMIDCGDNPVARLAAAGSSMLKVTDLVLTHFHADHVGSLPLLIMDMWLEKRDQPLVIHGLKVTLEKAQRLLELFSWGDWPGMFPVTFDEIPEDGAEGFISDSGMSISALPVLHLVPTIGVRVSFVAGRVISYSCDTEPSANLDKLAEGADVLLQEAAGLAKGHTSPEQAGEIAARTGVKKLILIHYENRVAEDELLAAARDKYAGEVALARDMMVV
jgi:ribonuclease Z